MTPNVAHLLSYADQVSFAGLRALGRGPLVQIMWILPGAVEEDALRAFDERLGHTLLGRRIERSSLPAGRHHWVRNDDPGEIRTGGDPLDPLALADWRASLVRRPVDPEIGPGRALVSRPLTDGSTAVVLMVSHTLADGTAINAVVRDAVLGRRLDLDLPPPRASVTWRERTEDARDVLGLLPDAAKGVAALARIARTGVSTRAGPLPPVTPAATPPATPAVRGRGQTAIGVPAVDVFVDEEHWRDRAGGLGGSSSTLLAGLAAHLGQALGRVDAQGRVVLDVPVSGRSAGDTAANAFVPMALRVNPVGITRDLRDLRAEFSDAVANARADGGTMAAVQALVPFVPRRFARQLDGLANGGGVVGCSHLGRLDDAVQRPLGADAIAVVVGRGEAIPIEHLDRLGGLLRVILSAVGGRVSIAVRAWQPGVVETSAALRPHVHQALDDFGLTAEVR